MPEASAPRTKIFKARFARFRIVAGEGGEHVERQARHLEAQIKHKQIARRYHEHGAERRNQYKDDELERPPALFFHPAGGEQQHQRARENDEQLGEGGEFAGHEHAVHRHQRAAAHRAENEAGGKTEYDQARADKLFAARRAIDAIDQQRQRGDRQINFRHHHRHAPHQPHIVMHAVHGLCSEMADCLRSWATDASIALK